MTPEGTSRGGGNRKNAWESLIPKEMVNDRSRFNPDNLKGFLESLDRQSMKEAERPETTASGWESLSEMARDTLPSEMEFETVEMPEGASGAEFEVTDAAGDTLSEWAVEEGDDLRPGYEGINEWKDRVGVPSPNKVWQNYKEDWQDWYGQNGAGAEGDYAEIAKRKGYNAVGEMPDARTLNEVGEEFFANNFHDLENPISEEAKQARIEMATRAALARIGAQEVLDGMRAMRTGVPPLATRGEDLMKQAAMETRSILEQMYNRNGYLREEMADATLGDEEKIAWKMASEPQKVGNVRSWVLMNEHPRREGETPAEYEARLKNYMRPSVNMDRQREADAKFEAEHPELLREKWVIDWDGPAEARQKPVKVEESAQVEESGPRAERAAKEKSVWTKLKERLGFKKLVSKIVGAFKKESEPETDLELAAVIEAGQRAAERSEAELEARKNRPVNREFLRELAARDNEVVETWTDRDGVEHQVTRAEVREQAKAEEQRRLAAAAAVNAVSLGANARGIVGMEAPDLPRQEVGMDTWGDDRGEGNSEDRAERKVVDVTERIAELKERVKRVELIRQGLEDKLAGDLSEADQEKCLSGLEKAEAGLLDMRAELVKLEQTQADRPEHPMSELSDAKLRGMFALEQLRTSGLFEGPYDAAGYEALKAQKGDIEEEMFNSIREAQHAATMLERFENGAAVEEGFDYQKAQEIVNLAPIKEARYRAQLRMVWPALREMRTLAAAAGGEDTGASSEEQIA